MERGHEVSDDALHNLKYYKYSGVDKSLLSRYVLSHYWNFMVRLFPEWMAPNLITLTGFGFVMLNVLCIVVFIPDLATEAHWSLYVSFAVGLFMYSTFDNVDGKQARRTGTSSPLGELFDHGIDSLTCALGGLIECAAMGLGSTRIGAFCTMIPSLPMFFSSWEQYYTKTLYLGYFNGPCEGILIACAIMISSAIWGPQIWHQDASKVFGVGCLRGWHMQDLFIIMCLTALLAVHLPSCMWNVYQARKSRNEPFLPTLTHWTPMIVFTTSAYFWLCSPHSRLLENNHLVLFAMTISMVFGRMTTKIILAHLTLQPFPQFTVLLVPLIVAAILVNWPSSILRFDFAAYETRYMWAYAVFALIVYVKWALTVIDNICQYLGIHCLTIPDRKRKVK